MLAITHKVIEKLCIKKELVCSGRKKLFFRICCGLHL